MSRRFPVFLFACVGLFALSSCGGSGNGDSDVNAVGTSGSPTEEATPTAPPHDADTSPPLEEPARQFALAQGDLGGGFLIDYSGTYDLNQEMYSESAAFVSAAEGAELLEDWGYAGGYETSFTPEGRLDAVLNGGYYIWSETHLFEDENGAKAAYTYINERLEAGVPEQTDAYPVGNESTAWTAVGGKLPGSSVDEVFHQVVFRRGNLVAIVQTWGAEVLMDMHPALGLARIVDEKALGQRDPFEPTPVPTATLEADDQANNGAGSAVAVTAEAD